MPNIRSAKKRMRSDAKKKVTNQTALSELRTLDSKLRKLASEPAKAQEFARLVISRYDKAVSHGTIPKGRADRKKSRIGQFLAKLKK